MFNTYRRDTIKKAKFGMEDNPRPVTPRRSETAIASCLETCPEAIGLFFFCGCCLSFSMSATKTIIFILIVAGLTLPGFQCSNSNNSKKESEITTDTLHLKNIAKEKFGSNYDISNNRSATHAIVTELYKGKIATPVVQKLNYFIFDYAENEIIFEDKLSNASVNWTNDSLITVSRPIGVIKKDSNSPTSSVLYTYNVKERKKSYK